MDSAGVVDSAVDAGFGGTTERTERSGDGLYVATLNDVRTAVHAGYERIVFEFREHVPGYSIEYATEAPAECGSGESVTVRGSTHLTVQLTPAEAHAFEGERAFSTVRERQRRLDYPALREMKLTCDFEAIVAWVLGVDRRRPYRVLMLESPPRLVVDIQTSD